MGIWPVKTEWWGAGVIICLERGALEVFLNDMRYINPRFTYLLTYLLMAQLMPLPLTVSCSSKIQIGFTFLVPAYPGCPGKEAVKWLL